VLTLDGIGLATSELPTYDECLVVLATKTGMTPSDWRDFFACEPEQQAAIAKTYADQQWVKNRDTFAEALAVLTVLATVAGAVTGVGSAVAAIKAL
jgi:hypothetical protein